jgi:pentatricopeptide repeat protein
MQAWAVSGRPYREVSQRLDQLLQSVDRPNLVLFNTVIHFYSRNVEMEKVEQMLAQMEKLDIPPNGSTTLNHLAHGYAQADQLRAAYDALEAMVNLDQTTEDQMTACAIDVLDACRRRVRAARQKRYVRADVEYAEKAYALLRTRVDGPSRSKCKSRRSPFCRSGVTD